MKDDEIQAYGDKVGMLEEELEASLNKADSPRGDKASGEEVKKLKLALAEEKSRHMVSY